MSREISLFADYQQRENAVTNYCGLMMKLIYEESPRRFRELLTILLPDKVKLSIGPSFHQQIKHGDSIPDLSIKQQSFTILFENKRFDWFHFDQIRRQIEGFEEFIENKIIFLLSNFENVDDLNNRFLDEIKEGDDHGIIIQPISYEQLVEALEPVCVTEYLQNLLEEFKTYLDRNNLLPRWKYLLDVVSCSGSMKEIQSNVYMCPDTGSAYSHRRAKYFGAYANKQVSLIFEINAVVVIGPSLGNGAIKWNNSTLNDTTLYAMAKEKISNFEHRVEENKGSALQVFLLSSGMTTKFIKDSSGGMLQSKKYFWNIAKGYKNSEELAQALNNKKWSDY